LGATTRCLIVLGPVQHIHGRPRTYLCNHHVAIAGKVRGPGWRVRAYRRVHRRGTTRYASLGVTTAAVVWSGAASRHD
jgi:hypothetical protein